MGTSLHRYPRESLSGGAFAVVLVAGIAIFLAAIGLVERGGAAVAVLGAVAVLAAVVALLARE
jgi:hypothetical protein